MNKLINKIIILFKLRILNIKGENLKLFVEELWRRSS